MKKLLLTLTIGIFVSLSSSAQSSKFNENEFIDYVNSMRQTQLIKSSDSCTPCVNELFSYLEKRENKTSSDILIHGPKINKRYGQVFVTILTNKFEPLNAFFSEIIEPIKSNVLDEKNKHFVLFHKELEDKVLIVFKVFK